MRGLGIPPTVLLNTDVYDEAPAVAGGGPQGRCRDRRPRPLQLRLAVADDPRRRARLPRHDVADRIRAHEGAAPGGWSSPWLSHTPATLNLLADIGYRYLLDLRLDDQPVWLTTESGPLLAIPYNAEINDSSTMIGRQASAHEFADMIVDEFAELCRGAAAPLVMSIVLHSFITGVPFRLRAVRGALERVAAGDGVWLTTPREIHQAVVDSRELFPPVAEVTS